MAVQRASQNARTNATVRVKRKRGGGALLIRLPLPFREKSEEKKEREKKKQTTITTYLSKLVLYTESEPFLPVPTLFECFGRTGIMCPHAKLWGERGEEAGDEEKRAYLQRELSR